MTASISTILLFPCTTQAQPGGIELPDSLVLRRGMAKPIMTLGGPTELALELMPSTGQINSLDFTSSNTVNGVTTLEKARAIIGPSVTYRSTWPPCPPVSSWALLIP